MTIISLPSGTSLRRRIKSYHITPTRCKKIDYLTQIPAILHIAVDNPPVVGIYIELAAPGEPHQGNTEAVGLLYRQGGGCGDGDHYRYPCIYRLIDSRQRLTAGGYQDALGEVNVTLEEGRIHVVGRGSSTDIIVASAKAYINALNKLEYRKSIKKK